MIEQLVLTHLIHNEEYGRKAIPFVKAEYFENRTNGLVYSLINEYVETYNKFPTKEVLFISVNNLKNINQETRDAAFEVIKECVVKEEAHLDWLEDQTEAWCKDRSLYNAVFGAIEIYGDPKGERGKIPQLVSDALAVSFDTAIGHDFIEDWEARYDFYHHKEQKIEFDLEFFNKITDGGLSRATLNVILAGTGVGKTRFMCHCSAANLSAGKNVLYITNEMSEKRIAERIDANLLDIPIDELKMIHKDTYRSRLMRIREKTKGKLIVKEYPTASAGAAHFRHLLNELKLKKNFIPDIIYIDYLNICISSRLKFGANVNSYTYIKSIAEELRGLAVEFDVPVMTATQTNRSGFTSSDVGLEDTSESFGLPATADFMFALLVSEELDELNQIMVKQLKNRYADPAMNRRFVIGVDRAKMKLHDVEESAQRDIIDGPVMDNSDFGRRDEEDTKRNKFEGIR